jgi:hypothetical protein
MGIGVSAFVLACSPSDAARSAKGRDSAIAMADTITLDSCASLDRQARAQNRMPEPGDTVPPPKAGSWTDVKQVSLDSFSIEVPRVASVRPRDAHGSYWITDLPTCRYFCAIQVTLTHDSLGQTVNEYVARLRVVDTTENPDAVDWIPGPPRAVNVHGDQGLMMETACGDCTAGQIVLIRNRTIAHLSYSLDDRDGYQPGLMCRLARAASTFQWNAPKA